MFHMWGIVWVLAWFQLVVGCSPPLITDETRFELSTVGRYLVADHVLKVRILGQLSFGMGSQTQFPVSPSGVASAPSLSVGFSYYVARVQRTLKGCPPSNPLILISSASSGAACGVIFPPNTNWLVVGSKAATESQDLDVIRTSQFTGTTPWAKVPRRVRQWLLGQEYRCGSVQLCANGLHIRLLLRCAESCPSCAQVPDLVCTTSLCRGCGLDAASIYRNSTGEVVNC